jgi:hypothetical protein
MANLQTILNVGPTDQTVSFDMFYFGSDSFLRGFVLTGSSPSDMLFFAWVCPSGVDREQFGIFVNDDAQNAIPLPAFSAPDLVCFQGVFDPLIGCCMGSRPFAVRAGSRLYLTLKPLQPMGVPAMFVLSFKQSF